MILTGKTMYVWKATESAYGVPAESAFAAHQAGIRAVLIKIANGASAYNIYADIDTIVATLANYDIDAWGWSYVYGDNPIGEATIAAQRVERFGLKGYIIDAESEYKRPGMSVNAHIFADKLRELMPDKDIALSTYRYPNYHMGLPWRQLLAPCTFVLPQVYWQGSHNPAYQLQRSYERYQELYALLGISPLPYVPTGSAYCESGWCATDGDIQAFLTQAKFMNFSGVCFWEWFQARSLHPTYWDVIRNFEWGDNPMTLEERVERLEQLAIDHGWMD